MLPLKQPSEPHESTAVTNDPQVVEEAPVSVEWLHDRQIVIFTLKAVTTRAVVDQWFDCVAGVVKSWPADKVYLAMQNVSDKRVTLTPYARVRIREFDELVKHLHGRIAIVLPNTFTGHLIRIFLTTMRWQKKLPTEGFLSFRDGLAWLEKALPTRDNAPPDHA